MTEVEIALLLLVSCTAGLLLLCLWLISRATRPVREARGIDPILGARDRVAIYRACGPFIQPHRDVLMPMPEHLRTRDEMVAWMTEVLPKAMESAARSPD
jgi:hypothetical protein